MSDPKLIRGRIVRAQSGFFDVETELGQHTAQLRGRLKQEQLETDVAAVGDQVEIRVLPDGSAMIETVAPRSRVLSRQAPGREAEQVLVANLDLGVFVFACAEPDPIPGQLRMLDRMLVGAERESIPVLICANKVDLVDPQEARRIFGRYAEIGYQLLYTSALTGEGIDTLRSALADHVSVFAGPSGTGKSSLLRALQPDIELRIGEVSEATGKGTHTTVAPKLVKLDSGGYVADTPGVKAFALWDIEPEELDAYFREIAPLVADCAFSNCTHIHEPGCAVLRALEVGEIHSERYDSYVRLRSS